MSSHSSPCCSIIIYVNDEKTSTRYTFTSYVCAELKQLAENLLRKRGIIIEHFTEDTVRKGVPLVQEIEETIRRSFISIVIVSSSYAKKDCLDQLLMILEQKKQRGDEYSILPVFHLVDPADVETQAGEFSKAFIKLGRKYGDVKAGQWKRALVDLVKIGGRSVLPTTYEVDIVNKLMEDVVEHIDWLEYKGIISGTLPEKGPGIETSIKESKKLMDSIYPSVWGVEKAENTGCPEIENGRSQMSPPPFHACSSGGLAYRGSGSAIVKSGVSMVDSLSEKRPSTESILEKLQMVKAFLSGQIELGLLSNIFEFLKGLTEADGIEKADMSELSYLQAKLTAATVRKLRNAEGRTRLELAIQKSEEQFEEYKVSLEKLERVRPDLEELEDEKIRIKAEIADQEKRYELLLLQTNQLRASLCSCAAELGSLSHQRKEKTQFEGLMQDALRYRKKLGKRIDGLISKLRK